MKVNRFILKRKTKCKICRADNRKEIERDMLKGMSYKDLDRKHSMTYITLRRHKLEHIPKELAESMAETMVCLDVPSIVKSKAIPIGKTGDCINYIHNELISIQKHASKTKDYALNMQALKLDMDCIGLFVKGMDIFYAGESQGRWEEMLPKILDAIEHIPEAKMAIFNALNNNRQ